jgi:hypothetical protein
MTSIFKKGAFNEQLMQGLKQSTCFRELRDKKLFHIQERHCENSLEE